MRSIAKSLSHNGYKPLNGRTPPTNEAQAAQHWDKNFSAKPSVLNALLAEQYHLCCYSEIRADEEGLGYHIEHVENKSQHPQRTFDPSNLAASAIDSNRGFQKLKAEPGGLALRFGGHAPGKSTGCDMAQFVSCHQANCSQFFFYLSDGRIKPAATLSASDAAKADYTIILLNLNSPYLVNRRRKWWKELQGKNDDLLDADVSVLKRLAIVDLLPMDGRLNRFFSLARQFFGPVAETTLTNHAPDLV